MSVLFQCLGITGVILMFYGLIAFAVTQASTWFFWTLLIGGAALVVVFIVTTLSRAWQAAVSTLVALNVPWVVLLAGKEWPYWVQGVVVGLAIVAVVWAGVKEIAAVAATAVVVAGSYAGLRYYQDASWFGYGVLAAAFVYNGAFLYLGRIFVSDLFEKRSMRYGTNAAIYTVICVAIVVVLNVLSVDLNWQYDATENKINTLTDQSVKILSKLEDKVEILAFFDDQNQQKAALKALLDNYRNESSKVKVKFTDPDTDRPLAVKHNAKDGDIVIVARDQSHITRDVSEQGVTQAILKVTRVDSPTVCFTKGHGELDIEGDDEDPRSLSGVKGGIENEGYVAKSIPTVMGGIPGECNILVIAGPKQKFTKEEAAYVDRYLETGGKSLWMLDPNVPNPKLTSFENFKIQETGLEDTARKWGVVLGRDIIIEQHLQLFQGMKPSLTIMANTYGDHPVVEPLKGRQTVFQNVRSVGKYANFDGTAIELVSSAGRGMSWAESDAATLFMRGRSSVGKDDLQGPVSLGVAIEREGDKKGDQEPKQTKLVVFGDGDFASNGMVRSYEFNFDLFLNALNWLQGEIEQISIRPKQIRTSSIELTPKQSNMIFYVAIIGIPMLVLIFGMDLWWIRRRRG